MSTVEERKKAREAYMAALQSQKQTTTFSNPQHVDRANIEANNQLINQQLISDSSVRDKIFEEKRKAFMERKSNKSVSEKGIVPPLNDFQKKIHLGAGGGEIQMKNVNSPVGFSEWSSSSATARQEDISFGPEHATTQGGQQEYSRALDQQMQQQMRAVNSGAATSSSSLQIGNDQDEERRRKRQQQSEYNRALSEQITAQRSKSGNEAASSVGGLSLGSDRDEELRKKREKQQEYTRGLNEQLSLKSRQAVSMHNPTGDKRIDSFQSFVERNHEDKFLKAVNQKEYASAAAADQIPKHALGTEYDDYLHTNARHGYVGGPEGTERSDKDKRQKQAEYAAFLNNQLLEKQYLAADAALAKKREAVETRLSPVKESPSEWYVTPQFSFLLLHSRSCYSNQWSGLTIPYLLLQGHRSSGRARTENSRGGEQRSSAINESERIHFTPKATQCTSSRVS